MEKRIWMAGRSGIDICGAEGGWGGLEMADGRMRHGGRQRQALPEFERVRIRMGADFVGGVALQQRIPCFFSLFTYGSAKSLCKFREFHQFGIQLAFTKTNAKKY